MTQLTFITPVAPYHAALLDRTIASVQAQTVACEHIVMHDSDERVYCDWFQKGEAKAAPDRAWFDGTWHPITTLIPTVCIN
jgi:hypothetical protein